MNCVVIKLMVIYKGIENNGKIIMIAKITTLSLLQVEIKSMLMMIVIMMLMFQIVMSHR